MKIKGVNSKRRAKLSDVLRLYGGLWIMMKMDTDADESIKWQAIAQCPPLSSFFVYNISILSIEKQIKLWKGIDSIQKERIY